MITNRTEKLTHTITLDGTTIIITYQITVVLGMENGGRTATQGAWGYVEARPTDVTVQSKLQATPEAILRIP